MTITAAHPPTATRPVRRAAAAVVALLALILSLLVAAPTPGAAAADAAPRTAFTPGQPWLDTSGQVIQAHGGQVVASTDDTGERIWYWFGEDRTNGYGASPGVHAYSSRDLYNWTDEGLALRAMTSTAQFTDDPYFSALYGGYDTDERAAVYRDLATTQAAGSTVPAAILERPKVIYNASTDQWVMWIHTDGPSATSNAQYAKATAGVAVSDSPTGPFRYIDSYRLHVAPEGEPNYQPSSPGMARDMNLFVDDDGTAYIIYSSEENYSLFISKLDASYTSLATAPADAVKGVDFTRPYIGAHREAPAIAKVDGTYYLITSGATGWDPNPASYATATDILGEWTDRGNPAVGAGAATTFRSQSTSIIPVDPAKGRYVYMGDRWTPSDLKNAPYVWLPMTFGESGALTITDRTSWTLDDLPEYEPWSVTSAMPEHVWLGDSSSLPATVDVSQGGATTSVGVTWDQATITTPGIRAVAGTLADGRMFTRSILVVPHGLRYVVNAGGIATDDWRRTVEIASTEGDQLASSPEQALGVDPVTGTTWGYTGDSASKGDTTGDLYTTLRWGRTNATLTYSFDGLAPGAHTVYLGYFDPWNSAGRRAKVTINGVVVEASRAYGTAAAAGRYDGVQVGADGRVTVQIAKAASPDIQISYVMVARPTSPQTVTFGSPAGDTTPYAGAEPIALRASSTSTLPVSFDASGACEVDGTVLALVAAGTCSVTASQSGDVDWSAAAPVTRSFTVGAALVDDFAGAGPKVSKVRSPWAGGDGVLPYYLLNGEVHSKGGGALLRSGMLASSQEASVRLSGIGSSSQGLVIKSVSASTTADGAITVVYDAAAQSVRVSTVGAAIGAAYGAVAATFAAGDVLTARYSAGGTVLVSKNGEGIASVQLSAGDSSFFDGREGAIGLWSAAGSQSSFDDVRASAVREPEAR